MQGNDALLSIRQIVKISMYLKGRKQQLIKLNFSKYYNQIIKALPLDKAKFISRYVGKLGFSQYFSTQNQIVQPLLSSKCMQSQYMIPALLQKLPSLGCMGCRDVFVKNFVICPVYYQLNQPFIIMSEGKFQQKEIQNNICGLCNKGGGYILYAKKAAQCSILQGFSELESQVLDEKKEILKKAFENVRYKQNISVLVSTLILKQDIKSILIKNKTQAQTEFVFKIKVSLNSEQKNKLFFIQYKEKNNLRSSYRVTNIKQNIINNFPQWKVIELKNSYFQLFSLTQQKINTEEYKSSGKAVCSCFPKKFGQIKFQINDKLIKQIKDKFQFGQDPTKLFEKICKGCLDIEDSQQFPPLKDNQRAVFFRIDQKQNKNQVIKEIETIFNHSKTEFKRIRPMPELQDALKQHRHKQSQTTVIDDIEYFIFKGQYQKFKQSIDKVGKNKNSAHILRYQLMTKKFSMGMASTENQLLLLQEMLIKKFQKVPKFSKSFFCLNDNGDKMLKVSVSINDLLEQSAAFYSFFLFQFAKKRPKFG